MDERERDEVLSVVLDIARTLQNNSARDINADMIGEILDDLEALQLGLEDVHSRLLD
jgi:hypothetical protein